ncbi:zinc-dependent alcohol dehydrogenase family protein [Microvirga splendida]|uniref:Zinc-dependent alcohol dehydrogenase family protein n=1 Tax=Microvirga splendida TaxID=2795727 RepID=A0ABS0Y8K5_9HYPH|nr:zinc-dependent alcohol dehydrogenase family protein [Microvirga splendida]MBJ6128270.1 zinc-dependent alcohol dehydrogenase family protein [Microvirga splendida]
MRAMVITRFGGPDVFEHHEIERPAPGPGEVLVRVIASGTNPVDAKIREAGTWAQIPFPAVLGYDVSGIIEARGPGVVEFNMGDEVFYTPEIFGNRHGSYAEYTIASASIVASKPTNLSHVEAAGIPLAGGTAWEAIVRRLNVRPGETVLIHGGAGGVGSFAIQFAKAAGARVIATASKVNHSAVQELGADVAVDYRDADVAGRILEATSGHGVDASFDTAGGNVSLSTLVTRPFGRIATILPPDGDLSALYTKNQTLFGTFLTREGARLREMTPLFERGQAKVVIDAVLPLEQVGKAHERLDSGHGRGKVILQVEQ